MRGSKNTATIAEKKLKPVRATKMGKADKSVQKKKTTLDIIPAFPKRPPSAYNIFMEKFREEYKENFPENKPTENSASTSKIYSHYPMMPGTSSHVIALVDRENGLGLAWKALPRELVTNDVEHKASSQVRSNFDFTNDVEHKASSQTENSASTSKIYSHYPMMPGTSSHVIALVASENGLGLKWKALPRELVTNDMEHKASSQIDDVLPTEL